MPDIQRIAVLYNPLKKRSAVDAYVAGIKQRAPHVTVELRTPTSAQDVRVQATAVRDERFDLLVMAGGDGTLLQGVNAVAESDTVITALPLGTGNDFARALGIETVEDGVRAVVEGTVRAVDAGQCSYVGAEQEETVGWFCSTAGVGMMADVFRQEPRPLAQGLKKLLGNGVWPLLTLYSMLTYSGAQARVGLGGQDLSAGLQLLEISKVREAGHEAFTPHARMENGLFDAWMVADAPRRRVAQIFLQVVRGGERHLSLPAFEYFTDRPTWNSHGIDNLTQITVDASTPMPVHLHGDYVGWTPARFDLRPGAVQALGLT